LQAELDRVDSLMNRFAGIVDLAADKTVQEMLNPKDAAGNSMPITLLYNESNKPSKADSDQMEQRNPDNIWLYYDIERL